MQDVVTNTVKIIIKFDTLFDTLKYEKMIKNRKMRIKK